MTARDEDEVCPNCGSRKLQRLVSRVSRGRSEDDRLDELSERLEQSGEPASYREMRETARELGRAMDDDMSDEMEEMLDAEEE